MKEESYGGENDPTTKQDPIAYLRENFEDLENFDNKDVISKEKITKADLFKEIYKNIKKDKQKKKF